MVHVLHFSVNQIRGALLLDDSMYLVRMAALDLVSVDTPGVAGTLNLHGFRIPVYSLHKFFGFPDRSPQLTDSLIIAKTGPYKIALWVDQTYVLTDEMMVTDPGVTGEDAVPGMTILPDGVVFIHDLPVFLDAWKTNDQQKIGMVLKELSFREENHRDHIQSQDEICSLEKTRRVLSERAAELAKPEGTPSETTSLEVLSFKLVYRDYAVEMRFVREVVLTREITPVPGTPLHIIGVCPVRGEIIPLVDLRVLLSIPEKGLTDLNQVIVLTDGAITFGILADQITGMTVIPVDEISHSNSQIPLGQPDFILGVDTEERMVINAAAIMADPTMVVDQSGESENLACIQHMG
ncbi:MAG: chemotaxis protein CheW [Methanospirillum sp.]|uniref:chemotaxis protein CheW n=1 Tax=Methanospirillum sp. TaxID=45200 RepID=UPI00237234E8|nr:chemotaxis protein CheW [Methanospirillum sp.]MDD1730210.1 chemotaxis protein CheW [Methanospirillum sp.]